MELFWNNLLYPQVSLSQEIVELSCLKEKKILEKSVGGSMLITICRWENSGFEF